MQKRGKTASGKQRWLCRFCKSSSLKTRGDTKQYFFKRDFITWLLGNSSLNELSSTKGVSRRTLIRHLGEFWKYIPQPVTKPPQNNYVLICDGVYIYKRLCCVLIAKTKTAVVTWLFVTYEYGETWLLLFRTLKQPTAVVCDGQKGLLLAIRTLWPTTKIQKCLAHVMRSEQIYLTKNPKTRPGKALLQLIKALPNVWTRRQKRRWLHAYFRLLHKYSSFLKERTYFRSTTGILHWWYTHRGVRSAYYLIKHNVCYLFTYIGHYDIPRTSNHVEGGINSRLKELLHRHRGLSVDKKKVLVSYFLLSKQH